MPLQKIHWSGPASGWAIWAVDEREDELASVLPETDQCPDTIRFHLKRLEWLAGRVLIRHLFNEAKLEYHGLQKLPSGKPYACRSAVQVALSNSYPFVAAQIHPAMPVGIDLERPRKNLPNVLDRILSPEERRDAGQDPEKMLVYWCAKEAMFKLHGERDLLFSRDLRIDPFDRSGSGTIQGSILANGGSTMVLLDYFTGPDFTLVTTNTQISP